jgi:hypothetical protein
MNRVFLKKKKKKEEEEEEEEEARWHRFHLVVMEPLLIWGCKLTT